MRVADVKSNLDVGKSGGGPRQVNGRSDDIRRELAIRRKQRATNLYSVDPVWA
jgi:hypothetical protein